MNKKGAISRTRMAKILEEELVLFELNEQVLNEHQRLVEERKDFQSLVLERLLKERYGEQIDVHLIEASWWERAKGGLAKMGKFSNLLPGAKMRNVNSVNDLEAAFEKVANDLVVAPLRTFQKTGYPNMKEDDQFRMQTENILAIYGGVVKAVQTGKMPYEAGEKVIDLLRKFISNSERQLKSIYTVTNEEQELEEAENILDENKIIEEARLDRLLKKIAFGEPSKRVVRVVKRIANRAAKSGDKAGKLGKIRDALVDTPHANIADRAIKTYRRVAQAGGAASGVASAAGTGAGTAAKGVAATGKLTTSAAAAPTQIVSTVSKSASVKGFLASLGLTPAMAAAGVGVAAAGFLFYKNRKSSRSAQLRDLAKKMVMPTKITKDSPGVEDAEELITDPEGAEDTEGTPEVGPEGGGEETTTAEPVAETIPISGTELKTMQFVAQQGGTDLFQITRGVIASLGAALKNPQIAPVVKAFNSKFYPQLKDIGNRVNVDVAEGLDLENLWNELLLEEPLTKRQQSAAKGRMRGGKGMKAGSVSSGRAGLAYFKSQGGRPPMIASKLDKAFRDALLKGVNADMLLDAAASVGATIKDPAAKKEYESNYVNLLQKNPNKRLQIYQQNVNAFVTAVVQMATAAATEALAAAPAKETGGKLPEHDEKEAYEEESVFNETLDRWHELAGIIKG